MGHIICHHGSRDLRDLWWRDLRIGTFLIQPNWLKQIKRTIRTFSFHFWRLQPLSALWIKTTAAQQLKKLWFLISWSSSSLISLYSPKRPLAASLDVPFQASTHQQGPALVKPHSFSDFLTLSFSFKFSMCFKLEAQQLIPSCCHRFIKNNCTNGQGRLPIFHGNTSLFRNYKRTWPIFIRNSHIWPPPVAIFLALWVWEGTGSIQDDKYLKW